MKDTFMNKKSLVCVIGILLWCGGASMVYAQAVNEGGAGDTTDLTLAKPETVSYGPQAKHAEEFVPQKVLWWKTITFPVMTITSPITFPGYYILTKEPTLIQSGKNYWKWIYFKVDDVPPALDDELEFPAWSKEYAKELSRKKAQDLKCATLLDDADELYKKGKSDRATRLYEKALQYDPRNEHAKEMLTLITNKEYVANVPSYISSEEKDTSRQIENDEKKKLKEEAKERKRAEKEKKKQARLEKKRKKAEEKARKKEEKQKQKEAEAREVKEAMGSAEREQGDGAPVG